MKNYIDAEKLKAKIRELRSESCISESDDYYEYAKGEIIDIITSLQQEQPKSTCKNCGFYENNCPFIRGKLIPYPNNVCKDYIYSAMKEQEQPEVDLNSKVTFDCISKKVTMSVKELINYYIDKECCDAAVECGF